MNNRADDAPRKEVKMYDPKVVVIIGLDTEDGPSHLDALAHAVDHASRLEEDT